MTRKMAVILLLALLLNGNLPVVSSVATTSLVSDFPPPSSVGERSVNLALLPETPALADWPTPTETPEPSTPENVEVGPYGLHYDKSLRQWSLYATVLQVKRVSVWGEPGQGAQIEYTLDGRDRRTGWAVVSVDYYQERYGYDLANGDVRPGSSLLLSISGPYVSEKGVDWDLCPWEDDYCRLARFVEGGYPRSVDYDNLEMSPTNTLIRSGFIESHWSWGMLCWKIQVLPGKFQGMPLLLP